MACEKIAKIGLLSVLSGITFFGGIRTVSVPCVAFDPRLKLIEKTEDLYFSLAMISIGAISSALGYYAVYRFEGSERDFKNWLNELHWSIKGLLLGVTSSLLVFGFLQTIQAIIRNGKEGAELSEMGNFIELMINLALFAIGLSLVATNYFRRQALHENADVAIPLSHQRGNDYGAL